MPTIHPDAGGRRGGARRVLIVGCGDVGQRVARLLRGRCRLLALSRGPERDARYRALGIVPVRGDLDDPASLRRLAGLADVLLHLAPPAASGAADARTRRLLAAVGGGILPQALVYISTSGVYGDCRGERVDETRPPRPATARAARRLDAEAALRAFARRTGVRLAILRAPGIWAAGRLPVERVRAGTPAVRAEEDSYSNHVHAEDLARAVVAAMTRGGSCRIFNTCDDEPAKMGDWFDAVAQAHGLARPPRVSREAARRRLPASLLSFLDESRRLDNSRIKRELRFTLRHPSALRAVAGGEYE